jgi:Tfp pilus assembly protein PilN
MSTQTVTRLGVTLPMVNLLPPEIAQQRTFRRVRTGLAAGVVCTVGIVAALFVLASSQVSQAQDDLDATKAKGVQLQTETAKYANVPAVIARVDAAKLQRSQAMAREIRWSRYLNDLSLQIPAKVWLTSVNATETVDTVATAAAATPPTVAYPVTGIGTVTFEGKAYSHNDVATWLEMLARQPGYSQAYLTSSSADATDAEASTTNPVAFTSSVTLIENALSRRYELKAGS